MNTQKPDMPPETPPEVMARGPRSLTQETANLTGNSTVLGDAGDLRSPSIMQQEARAKAASRAAAIAAEEWAGPTPLAGLTPEQIAAIKGKDYAGAPKYSMVGDRDQKFVNWIWANHPNDAKVRYAYRNIWPEVWIEPTMTATEIVSRKSDYDHVIKKLAAVDPSITDTLDVARLAKKANAAARMAKARAARKPKVTTATPEIV